MTTENFYNLASEGKLQLDYRQKQLPHYCIAAAVDRVFTHTDVPLSIYELNDAEMRAAERGDETSADRFFNALGEAAFKIAGEDFLVTPYEFNSLEEFQTDIAELREQEATVLVDVRDGVHSLGLKPVDGEPDQWEIVGGIEDLICVYSDDTDDVDVQMLRPTEPKTSAQVWEHMLANNSDTYRPLTAMALPPEPTVIK